MLDRIENLALVLWVGALLSIGYLAAPVLFQNLEDRRLAGELAGVMFRLVGWIGLVAGAGLLIRSALRSGIRHWRAWTLLGMLILVAIMQFGLQPYMADLKAQGLAVGSDAARQFGMLHGVSSLLYLLNSIRGVVLVLFGLVPRARSNMGGFSSGRDKSRALFR